MLSQSFGALGPLPKKFDEPVVNNSISGKLLLHPLWLLGSCKKRVSLLITAVQPACNRELDLEMAPLDEGRSLYDPLRGARGGAVVSPWILDAAGHGGEGGLRC